MVVLLVAHELSPILGSECNVGWNILLNLARYKELSLVVLVAETNQKKSQNYRSHLEAHIKSGDGEWLKNVDFHFIPQASGISTLKLFSQSQLFYWVKAQLWERRAFKYAKRCGLLERVDLIHHLTHVSFKGLGNWRHDTVPLVVGPKGGFEEVNIGYFDSFSTQMKIAVIFRRLFNFSFILIQALRFRKKAELAMVVSLRDFSLAKNWFNYIERLSEVGVERQTVRKTVPNQGNVTKIAWAGRLDELKGTHILQQLILKFMNSDYMDSLEFNIYGMGPCEPRLHRVLKHFDNVNFHGSLERAKFLKELSNNDLFIHTSLKEATSVAILEAISRGLPVIAHNLGSLSSFIKVEHLIPLENTASSVQQFYTKIVESVTQTNPHINTYASPLSWEELADKVFNNYYKAYENFNRS